MWALAGRDTLYLVGILLLAGLLLFFGRDLLQGSVLVTWGLTFGGTTEKARRISSVAFCRDGMAPRTSAGWTRISSCRSGRPPK